MTVIPGTGMPQHAQSHATTLPLSNDARYPSSAPQKAYTVFLVS
jgi:hypothetical protein